MKGSGSKKTLSHDVHIKIQKLTEQGDMQAETGDYLDAITSYQEAWELLPEPRTEWEAATWILGAMGDTYFSSGDFEAGRDILTQAMDCPNGLGNPFLHLRLGQCQYELGNTDRASDELIRAYMGAGKEIFDHDHRRYFEFLTTQVKAPPGGWQ